VSVFHHPADSIGAFAVVGMGAAFAGIIRAPMTSVLIIFEMTGGYGLVLPLMIANMTAFALARSWRRTPIYEALLEQDGIFLPGGGHPLESKADEDELAHYHATGESAVD
jgi:CIC family chloride channel protein